MKELYNIQKFQNFKECKESIPCISFKRRYDYHIYSPFNFLVEFCKRGYMEEVSSILNNTQLFHIANYEYQIVFQWACFHGWINIIKLLLKSRYINVHKRDEDAFSLACFGGHIKIVKLLLSLGCSNNEFSQNMNYNKIDIHADHEKAFRFACASKRTKIVKLLLSLGSSHPIFNTSDGLRYERTDPININVKCDGPIKWEENRDIILKEIGYF